MRENKITSYLLYVLGEITLVVVGILIAVQIDDWNQQRVDSNTVRKLLVNLKAEQEFNQTYLKARKKYLKLASISGLELLRAIEAHEIPDERTTDSLLFKVIATNSTNLSQGAFLDIISTGKINLIRNDTLRYLLLSFGSKVEGTREQERLNNELLNSSAIPYLYDHFAFTKMDSRFHSFDSISWPKGRFDSDLKQIFNDRQFETILDDLIYRNQTINAQTDLLLSEIQTSLNLINRELNN